MPTPEEEEPVELVFLSTDEESVPAKTQEDHGASVHPQKEVDGFYVGNDQEFGLKKEKKDRALIRLTRPLTLAGACPGSLGPPRATRPVR